MSEHLGKKILDRLEDLEKTQAWLANEMDVSNNAVTKWVKTGGVSGSRMARLAKVLETSLDELLADITPPTRKAVVEGKLERLDAREARLVELFRECEGPVQGVVLAHLEKYAIVPAKKQIATPISLQLADKP